MFFEWLDKQRAKSAGERRLFSLLVAMVVTGVIAGFYIASFVFVEESTPSDGFAATNPFSGLIESFSKAWEERQD
jgi:hypothetical protein